PVQAQLGRGLLVSPFTDVAKIRSFRTLPDVPATTPPKLSLNGAPSIFGTIRFRLMRSGNLSSPRKKAAAIISKPGKPELAGVVPELVQWLQKHKYSVVVDPETEPYASGVDVLPRDEIASRGLSFVVVLGGDGTLLAAARAVAKAGIPVLGVNLGSLGFLTEVPLPDLYTTLQEIEEGCCQAETRSMVHCEIIRKGSCVARYDALNDIVVGKATIARLNHSMSLSIKSSFPVTRQTVSLSPPRPALPRIHLLQE